TLRPVSLQKTAHADAPAVKIKESSRYQEGAHTWPSIGIPNRGDTCFLASMMQKILIDPALEKAICDPQVAVRLPNTVRFIAQYRIDQKEKRATTQADIGSLRDDLFAITKDPKLKSGQHDAHETLAVLLAMPEMDSALKK